MSCKHFIKEHLKDKKELVRIKYFEYFIAIVWIYVIM